MEITRRTLRPELFLHLLVKRLCPEVFRLLVSEQPDVTPHPGLGGSSRGCKLGNSLIYELREMFLGMGKVEGKYIGEMV